LQTIAALVGGDDLAMPHLPFALDEVEIVRPLALTCYAYAEYADLQMRNHTGASKFNIRILNESGSVLVALRNLYVRPIGRPLTSSQPTVAAERAANGRSLSLAGEPIRRFNTQAQRGTPAR
jgi:polyketide synthase PksN